jgi:hypothetical protein
MLISIESMLDDLSGYDDELDNYRDEGEEEETEFKVYPFVQTMSEDLNGVIEGWNTWVHGHEVKDMDGILEFYQYNSTPTNGNNHNGDMCAVEGVLQTATNHAEELGLNAKVWGQLRMLHGTLVVEVQ